MRRAVLAGVLVLAACGKTTAQSGPAPAPRTLTLTCETVFAAPPKGELLCDEHIMGSGAEIHWRSYGLSEDRAAYCEPYLEAARSCHFGWMNKPPTCDVSDNKDLRVALFYKEEGGFPTCTKAPSAAHRTIIVISEQHKRP